jgi:hypothetical protein
MKCFALGLGALLAASMVAAQEIELPPIVVASTFELRQGPSATDLFTLHLQKQIETKRAVDEAMTRAPWYYSRFWSFFPMQLQSSSGDSAQFFTPRYLTLDVQHAEQELRRTEKQSLFDRR